MYSPSIGWQVLNPGIVWKNKNLSQTYVPRCPFSLSRLLVVSAKGQVVYQAGKQACRVFPHRKKNGAQAGVNCNFQILSPLDYLAEFTQHIPAKSSHLIAITAGTSTSPKACVRRRKLHPFFRALRLHFANYSSIYLTDSTFDGPLY